MNAELLEKARQAADCWQQEYDEGDDAEMRVYMAVRVAIEACAEIAEDCDSRGLGVTEAGRRIRALLEPAQEAKGKQ